MWVSHVLLSSTIFNTTTHHEAALDFKSTLHVDDEWMVHVEHQGTHSVVRAYALLRTPFRTRTGSGHGLFFSRTPKVTVQPCGEQSPSLRGDWHRRTPT